MPLHSQVLQTFLLLAYFPLCVTLSRFPILAQVLKSFKTQESNPLLRVSPSWYWGLTQCQQVLGKKWNVSDFFFFRMYLFLQDPRYKSFPLEILPESRQQALSLPLFSYFSLYLDDERSWTRPFLSFYSFTLKMNNIGTVKKLCPLNITQCFLSLK